MDEKSFVTVSSHRWLAISAVFLNASHWRKQGLMIINQQASLIPLRLRYVTSRPRREACISTPRARRAGCVRFFAVNPPGNAHSSWPWG